MNEHEIKGAANDVAGKVQGAAGALTGDNAQEAKGKVREVAGKVQASAGEAASRVQESAGEALDSARSFAASRPIGAMLGAAGVGFLLGALFARRD